MTTHATPRRQRWSKHIESWRSSGLSQNAYCREHDLRANQFSYWKRQLTTLPCERKPTPKTALSSSAFVPLAVNTAIAVSGGLTLRLPSGVELTGIETQHLPLVTQLLKALK